MNEHEDNRMINREIKPGREKTEIFRFNVLYTIRI